MSTNVCARVLGGLCGWSSPFVAFLGSDSGAFSALGGEEVGVAGVGVAPAQVGVEARVRTVVGVVGVVLRDAIERAESRRFGWYWLHRSPVGELARRLINHRGAIPVEITDADTALGTLQANVEALAEAADQRPQVPDLAVARLKKFLPNHEHRIRLHDLVAVETQAAISRSASPTTNRSLDQQERQRQIESRAGDYEMAVATLLRLLIVGARFSDREEHDRLWANCASTLASHAPLRGGDVRDLGMQFYPALLALYALALGSAAADRLDPIAHTLATVSVKPPPGRLEEPDLFPVVAVMDRVDEAMFPSSAGRRSVTRLSDRLLEVLRPAAADVLPIGGRPEELFDEAEHLLGLAFTGQCESLGLICPISRATRRPQGEHRLPGSLVDRHERILTAHGVFRDARHLSEARDAYSQAMQEHGNQIHTYRSGGSHPT